MLAPNLPIEIRQGQRAEAASCCRRLIDDWVRVHRLEYNITSSGAVDLWELTIAAYFAGADQGGR